ncbi:12175_t:CDS:2 [Acaulospora colombiana]|uniref:12175_t:CDS:1 n=1 Tax=Acaulospora colombiana TaxID=27376 RepID=A0ACA9M7W5_9GLOM|nr:12175_t:CDS:2 [Acaulospora colombiana]
MAAYFPLHRRRVTPIEQPHEAEPHQDRISESTSGNHEGAINDTWAANASMLIFPSPSSSLPPTPASSNAAIPLSVGSASLSNLSLPTSMSLGSPIDTDISDSSPVSSRRMRLRMPRTQAHRDHRHASMVHPFPSRFSPTASSQEIVSPLNGLQVELESSSEASDTGIDIEVWEWSSIQSSSEELPMRRTARQEPLLRSLPDTGFNYIYRDGWLEHTRGRTISQFTQVSNNSALSYFSHSTDTSSNRSVPPTPIHFPFLSIIKRIFTLDSETVLLLGVLGHASGAEADLFLSSPYDLPELASSSEGEPEVVETIDSTVTLLTQAQEGSPRAALISLRRGLTANIEEDPSFTTDSTLALLPTLPLQVIQNILWAPISVTSSITSNTLNTTSQVMKKSTSMMGDALHIAFKPALSAIDNWSEELVDDP